MTMIYQDTLSGALVADAAALGLHWLYEPRQISRLEACGDLMFRQPDAAVYENQKAFFAQGDRKSGQLSHYGESARLVGQLAVEDNYSPSTHRSAFMDSFGPCGSFVGYADRPTKSLVANIIQQGDNISDASGVNDDQMPAMCVVPGLFSVNTDASEIALAASVISTHSHVTEGVSVLLSCLNALANGSPMVEALEKSISSADDALAALLQEAIDSADDESTVADHFGRACKIYQGMPLSWYLLSRFNDFESVALANVRCGGDNCGRSMIIGSIAGFAYGVPGHLIKNLTNKRVPINYP